MRLFRRTPAVAPQRAAAVPIDPSFGDPDAAQLRVAMAAAEWPTARALLTAPDSAEERSFYLDVAAEVPGSERWLPDVIRADLADAVAVQVYGARAAAWAWEARGRKLARYVAREQFELFFERLHIAEDSLQGVVRRDPDNVAAWEQLITTAMGLQLGADEARRRFDQVVARCPGHIHAHRKMLQVVCAKWSGSHKDMHAFAREALDRAEPGSPLGTLTAAAHIENWLALDSAQRAEYVAQRRLRSALQDAADRSVRHPAYQRRPGWLVDHNLFAAAFCLVRDHRSAAAMFEIIGDRATRTPWRYFDAEPGAAFVARRQRAVENLAG